MPSSSSSSVRLWLAQTPALATETENRFAFIVVVAVGVCDVAADGLVAGGVRNDGGFAE